MWRIISFNSELNLRQTKRYLTEWDCFLGSPTNTPYYEFHYEIGDYYVATNVSPDDKNRVPCAPIDPDYSQVPEYSHWEKRTVEIHNGDLLVYVGKGQPFLVVPATNILPPRI